MFRWTPQPQPIAEAPVPRAIVGGPPKQVLQIKSDEKTFAEAFDTVLDVIEQFERSKTDAASIVLDATSGADSSETQDVTRLVGTPETSNSSEQSQHMRVKVDPRSPASVIKRLSSACAASFK